MNRRTLLVIPLILALLLSGVFAEAKGGPPVWPDSFYGEIHFSDTPPAVGTAVQAFVPGYVAAIASSTVREYGGGLVYDLDVPAEDLEESLPGATEGATVTFKVGGRTVATAVWHSGDHTQLDFHPPAANAGGSYVGLVNTAIPLSASATDWLVTDTFSYAWDLDDDGAYDDSTLQNPSQAFGATGVYPVGVLITDAQGGQGTATATVVIVGLSGLTGQTYSGSPIAVTVSGDISPFTYTVTYNGSATPPTNAGTYPVVVTIYNGATSVGTITQDLVIAPRPASVTPNLASKIYGDPDPASLTGTLTGFIAADNVTATYTRAAGENAGPYTISATLSASGLLSNYAITSNTAVFTITPKAAAVTPNPAGKVFGGSDPTLTGTLTGFLPADGVTATYSRAAGENAGPYTISAALSASGLLSNYAITYNTAIFTITPRPITITPVSGWSKVYGDLDPNFAFTCSETCPTTIGALGRVAGENVGTYAITLGTLGAGSNYIFTLDPTPVMFGIEQRVINVSADAKTKAFGAGDPALTYTYTPALAFTDTFTGALSRAGGENVGTYAISQGSLALSSNYTLSFTGANLTITAQAVTITPTSGQTKVYGFADPAFTFSCSITCPAFTGALSRVTPAVQNVGSYAITLGDLSAGSNYTLTLSATPVNFTITTRAVAVTAEAKTKAFGDSDPALTYTYTPALAYTDSFTGALSRTAGEAVGTYPIAQGSLALNSNYTLSFTGANLTITARPITITPTAGQNKVYGDLDPNFAFTCSETCPTTIGALGRVAGENVGTYAITLGTLGAGPNYIFTLSAAPVNFTILPRLISVSADAKTKAYGDTDPALTYSYTGTLVSPDAFSGGLIRAPGTNVGTYAITQGSLALSSNYTLSFTGANLTITARPITVTAQAKTKMYGEADPALTYTYTGTLISPDVFTGALIRETGNGVGTYDILQGSLALTSNYAITFVGADFTITTRAITVTADNKSKAFGASDPALTYTYTGTLVSPDVFTGALIRGPGEAVGSYAIGQGNLALSSNYTLTFVPGVFTITNLQRSIALLPGWNLVSFDLHPVSTALNDVLASVNGNYTLVYAWDATGGHPGSGNWLRADDQGMTLDDLTTLDETMGFWIRMKTADTLEINGTYTPSTTIALSTTTSGWNLVGYPSASGRAMPGALSANGAESFTLAYSYRANDPGDLWKLYDVAGPGFSNDLTTLTPGWGYWVKVTAPESWMVAY